ncbi:MAG: hypothetical protein IJU02_03345 [Lachnospiraceae bacterium]|nr:hypothetical protein [Lachnospiraceae bacterium]
MSGIISGLSGHPIILIIVFVCTLALGFLLWFIVGRIVTKNEDKDVDNKETKSDAEQTIYQRGKDISVQINQARDADSGKFYNSKLRIIYTAVIVLLAVGMMIAAFLLIK